MKTGFFQVGALALAMTLMTGLQPSHATPFLSVDFEPSGSAGAGTETGFSSQAVASKSHTTSEGSVTVAVSGHEGFFARNSVADSGAFTYGQLYDDFVYNNTGGTLSFTISGAGIKADTDYSIRFFAYDRANLGSTATNGIIFDPVSDTTGSSGQIAYSTTSDPTSNEQYSFVGIWRATDGSLDIDVTFVSDDLSGFDIVRVNGLQISAIPEPGTLGILGLGLVALGFARRRRAA